MKFWEIEIMDKRVETVAGTGGMTREVDGPRAVIVRSFSELERVAKGCCLLIKGDVDVSQYIDPANQVALGLIENIHAEPFGFDEMVLGSPLDPVQHFRPAPRDHEAPSPDTVGLLHVTTLDKLKGGQDDA